MRPWLSLSLIVFLSLACQTAEVDDKTKDVKSKKSEVISTERSMKMTSADAPTAASKVAKAMTVEKAAAKLADKIAAFMKASQGSMGFLMIPITHNNMTCELGEQLNVELCAQIQKLCPGAVSVLSSERADALLTSIVRQHSDRFSESSGIPAMGELHGYRFQIQGTLSLDPDQNETCRARMRIINLEKMTEAVIQADMHAPAHALVPLEEGGGASVEEASICLKFECLLVEDPSGLNQGAKEDSVDLLVDEKTKLRFILESETDTYVYIVSVGSSGRAMLVFPNAFHGALLSKGEMITILPDTGTPYCPEFQFENVKGEERFFVVASVHPPSEVPLLSQLDELEKIEIVEVGGIKQPKLPTPLSDTRTASLIAVLQQHKELLEKGVKTQKIFQLIEEGTAPAKIRTRDLALPSLGIQTYEDIQTPKRFTSQPFRGTDLLIREIVIQHR